MPTPGASYDMAGQHAIDAWREAYDRHTQLLLKAPGVPPDQLGPYADALEAAEREMNLRAVEMEKFRIA